MIPNPTPINATPFNGLWITSCLIVLPSAGRITRTIQPYNGTDLLERGRDDKTAPILRGSIDPALAAMEQWLQNHFAVEANVLSVQIAAPYPDKPVSATVTFVGSIKRIPDCFALAAEDATFAALFTGLMSTISA